MPRPELRKPGAVWHSRPGSESGIEINAAASAIATTSKRLKLARSASTKAGLVRVRDRECAEYRMKIGESLVHPWRHEQQRVQVSRQILQPEPGWIVGPVAMRVGDVVQALVEEAFGSALRSVRRKSRPLQESPGRSRAARKLPVPAPCQQRDHRHRDGRCRSAQGTPDRPRYPARADVPIRTTPSAARAKTLPPPPSAAPTCCR